MPYLHNASYCSRGTQTLVQLAMHLYECSDIIFYYFGMCLHVLKFPLCVKRSN